MKTKTIIAIATVLAMSLLVLASQSAGLNSATVQGFILNETGHPVAYAAVEWRNNDTGDSLKNTTSGSDGFYAMNRVFDGTIESLIIASHACYITNSTVISTTAAFPPNIYDDVNLTLKKDTIAPIVQFIPPTPANESINTTGYLNTTVNVTDPSSGTVDSVSISVWNETGQFLDVWNETGECWDSLNNKTMHAFDKEHKYYYTVSSYNASLSQYVPLPDGNYTCKAYAKDATGNMGKSETRVVTVNVTTAYSVDVTLESGWNMIGVPLDVSDWTLPTVLSSIEEKYDYIYYYNATTPGMDYYVAAHPEASTLNELEPLAGYLVNISAADTCLLQLEGKKFVAPSRDLEIGWNMFSVPYGVIDKTLPAVLSSIDGKYDYVYYYNATTPGMDYYVAAHPEASTLNGLEPGAGYLINVTEASIFITKIGGE